MDGDNKMVDQEYDMNWICDQLVTHTDSSIFNDDFKTWIVKVTDAARKYVKIKEALK